MTTVILCGGSGTRLWPMSRSLMPKQFIAFFSEPHQSLFQKTLDRNLPHTDSLLVVTNADHYFLALDQARDIGVHKARFLLEGSARNTAPAIALACLSLDPSEIVLVVPSDHLIKDQVAYDRAIKRACELAKEGFLVTFGIKPDRPETGFGYIQSQGEQVLSFKEKPDLATAESYLHSGDYHWNSGMFCFQASTLLEELERYAPTIKHACDSAHQSALQESPQLLRLSTSAMEQIPEESLDYALLEHSDKVRMVACDIGWSDLGSFESLHEELPQDAQGNSLSGAILLDCKENLILTAAKRQVAAIDLSNLMIIDTPDALLIAPQGSGQRVKEVVAQLKERGSDLHHTHLTVHRPWGSYTTLEEGKGYKIKRIVVAPQGRLSLQKHLHRSEHWIVISGVANVTIGDQTSKLYPNESTYIKMGETHRLANEETIPLVLIEVQTGNYTGEDDIIRLEDDYSRQAK